MIKFKKKEKAVAKTDSKPQATTEPPAKVEKPKINCNLMAVARGIYGDLLASTDADIINSELGQAVADYITQEFRKVAPKKRVRTAPEPKPAAAPTPETNSQPAG